MLFFRKILVLSLILFVSVSGLSQVTVVDTIDFGSNVVWSIGVNPETNKIYVGVQFGGGRDYDSVFVFDGLSHSLIRTFKVGGGISEFIGVNPITNRIYVASMELSNVSVINGVNDSIVSTIGVGSTPWGVGVNAKTNKIYVSNYLSCNVTVIDGAENSVINTVKVGGGPEGLWVDTLANRIYVANYLSDSVYVIDGTNDSVITKIEVGPNPETVCGNLQTNRVYVANADFGGISVIDRNSDSLITSIPILGNPRKIDVNPGNNHIYVGTYQCRVNVIDGLTNSVIDSIGLGGPLLTGFTVNPQTNRIYVGLQERGLALVLEDSGADTFITVTNPNGGEDWQVDSTYDITWTSNGTSGNVQIEYSTDNGSSWSELIASMPDTGSYPWVIPDNPSDSCFVRISDTVGNPSDVSDSIFTISSGSGIEDSLVLREEVSVRSFRSGIKIHYSLPKKEKVKVEVYNVLGQRKEKLLDEIRPSGRYTLNWKGNNGIYFVRVEIGDRVYKEKVFILR